MTDKKANEKEDLIDLTFCLLAGRLLVGRFAMLDGDIGDRIPGVVYTEKEERESVGGDHHK